MADDEKGHEKISYHIYMRAVVLDPQFEMSWVDMKVRKAVKRFKGGSERSLTGLSLLLSRYVLIMTSSPIL